MAKPINLFSKQMDASKSNQSNTIITSLSLSKETLELEKKYKEFFGMEPPRSKMYNSKLKEIMEKVE